MQRFSKMERLSKYSVAESCRRATPCWLLRIFQGLGSWVVVRT